MVEAQRDPRAIQGDAEDVTRVLSVLHHAGPLPLRELADEPELAEWTHERIEHAVVSAWSRALIFVDTRDLLVAL
ncbi:hypothetical protein ACVW00_001935 [Marmoricola sp. URHA0025 HA25]